MKIDPNILNAFLTLMGSVALLGVILYVMKKFTLKFKSKGHDESIEVVSKLNLSPKNSLWTIKFQGKTLLLGVSEKNINLLSEVNSNEQISNKVETKTNRNRKQNLETSNQPVVINDDLSFKEFLKSAVFKSN